MNGCVRLVCLSVGLLAACSARSERARQVEQKVLADLAEGRQVEAEHCLEQALAEDPDDQELVFLSACCTRSRFELESADPLFARAWKLGPDTPSGRCALLVMGLDAGVDRADESLASLQALADEHPERVPLRWMLAVQCRSLHRNELGIAQYRRILEDWKPGPALVHQTFANLYSALGREEEALAERQESVRIEPASWNLNDLGDTLADLGRRDEACEAHARAAALSPRNATYRADWGDDLLVLGHVGEAEACYETATELKPDSARAWRMLGYCAERLGCGEAARADYEHALGVEPSDRVARDGLVRLGARGAVLPPGVGATLPVDVDPAYVPYQHHELTPDADLAALRAVANDLAEHAGREATRIRSIAEHERVRVDIEALAERLDRLASVDSASADVLLLTAQVHTLGRNLEIPGHATPAVQAFERVLSREPQQPEASFRYGLFLADSSGRRAEGAAWLQQAADLGVETAWCELGALQLKLGDVDEARGCLETFNSRHADDALAGSLLRLARAR